MENLSKAYEILYAHKSEMENFMEYYVLKKMKISKDTFLSNEEDFLRLIKFCLNTAQKVKKENIKKGLDYFKKRHRKFIEAIENNDVEALQDVAYNAPGMGQKIGSMLLEIIYMYSNKRNDELAKKLYLPLDTHVIRLLKDSFKINNIPQGNNLKIDSKKFIDFQKSLEKYSSGKPIVYFDYLWFIGKMFCNKIDENSENSRGYKLCNYCWIKDCCENSNRWL